MNEFKSDKDYGYTVSLLDGRELPEGHKIFKFTDKLTEVDVLKEILDKYIDTSNVNSTCDLVNHKIDFGLTFIDSMILITKEKLNVTELYLRDIEIQLNDINHRIIKPTLSGKAITKDEKLEIFDMQEELLIQRRNLKDSFSIQKVFMENLEKTRNFILAMNQRMYSPKSERFQNDSDFYINNGKDNTRINTSK